MGVHVVWSDEKWAQIQDLLKNAGHDVETEVVAATKSNALTFVAKLQNDFPEVYADIKKGIADLKDSSLSGGDKAVKVATDVLTSVPDVLKAIPGIKSALVSAVTVAFADEVSDLKNIAISEITKL